MSKKRRSRRQSRQTVATVTSPGQVAVMVPLLLGFQPHDSLVVMCGHEPRGRIGLTFRVDLPGGQDEDAMAELVEGYVRQDGATRFSLLVFSDEPGQLPRAALVDRVRARLGHLREMEVLLVRGGRWWSYTCTEPCCPPEGRPLSEEAGSSPVTLVAAEQVLRGQVLAGSREELAARLAGPSGAAAEEAVQRCHDAAGEIADAIRRSGAAAAHRMLAQRWDAAIARFHQPPAGLDDHEVALLVMSLELGAVRDHVNWGPEADLPATRGVLAELLRRTPAPVDAVVSAAYGWVTYLDGGGALASIAAERAMLSDPTHSLVRLLDDVLVNAVPPGRLREIMGRHRHRLTA